MLYIDELLGSVAFHIRITFLANAQGPVESNESLYVTTGVPQLGLLAVAVAYPVLPGP